MEELAGVNEGASTSPEETKETANAPLENTGADKSSVETNSTQQEKLQDKRIPYERFQEVVEERNFLRKQMESKSESALNKREEVDPVEQTFQSYVKAGLDEKSARLLAENQVKAAEAVANKRISSIEDDTRQMITDQRVAALASKYKDYEELRPLMYQTFLELDPAGQEFASTAKGLELLYRSCKAQKLEQEDEKTYNKGVQDGFQKKKIKESFAPTNGATVASPASELTEEAIAAMPMEEYMKRRTEIIASRAPKRRQ